VILYLAVFSFVIALLRGGKLKHLGQLQLRQMWLAFMPLVFILLLDVTRRVGYPDIVRGVSGWFHLLAYCLLLALVWVNRRLAGTLLLAFGLFLNMVVLAFNDGRMPVSYAAAKRAHMRPFELRLLKSNDMQRHLLMSSRTRLNFLADIIPIRYPTPEVVSVGDLVLAGGVFILIQAAMLPPKRAPAGC